MLTLTRSDPGRRRRLAGSLAAAAGAVALMVAALLAGPARAADNASSAAGFIENAQNADGGFSETHGQPSSPSASLWATVALLAAGRNPQDEKLGDGTSAAAYLSAHTGSYHSLLDLGLLAIVQAASGIPAGQLGDPEHGLRADLTIPAIRSDPEGAAMGVIGLLALNANSAATSAARSLVADQLSDGGWGARNESDSASTALALEAIAQSNVGASAATAVKNGIAYLGRAQVNDGSIAISDRTNASSSGDVGATAFTIQALAALHHRQLRTPTGTTVLQGLASYQQLSSGGLSPYGAYDTGVEPSVTETAEAYPAFDGASLPLTYVAPTPPPASPTTTPAKTAVNRASTGTAAQGISAAGRSPTKSVGAYAGASAAGRVGARPHRRTTAASGTQVSGTVVGATAAPKLTTRAGRPPAPDHTTLYLALGLFALAGIGAAVDLRRPRAGTRHPVAVAVQAGHDLTVAARRRGAFAPAAVVLVGLALIATPVVTGMWSRAPKGASMLSAFQPDMAPARLDRLSGEVDLMNAAFHEARSQPATRAFATGQWPGIDRRFAGLLGTVSASRTDDAAISSLPSLRLFPWFLAIPGALLVLIAGAALIAPSAWRRARSAVAVLGVLLVAGPFALGLFGAAPHGSHLIRAFRTVETTASVTALQNDFVSLVTGEGQLSTALPRHAGAADAAERSLEARWVTILGDFTPLLGVMSDNVANYRATAALPDFFAFPWLFVIPGLLALAVALFGRPAALARSRRLAGSRSQIQARSSA